MASLSPSDRPKYEALKRKSSLKLRALSASESIPLTLRRLANALLAERQHAANARLWSLASPPIAGTSATTLPLAENHQILYQTMTDDSMEDSLRHAASRHLYEAYLRQGELIEKIFPLPPGFGQWRMRINASGCGGTTAVDSDQQGDATHNDQLDDTAHRLHSWWVSQEAVMSTKLPFVLPLPDDIADTDAPCTETTTTTSTMSSLLSFSPPHLGSYEEGTTDKESGFPVHMECSSPSSPRLPKDPDGDLSRDGDLNQAALVLAAMGGAQKSKKKKKAGAATPTAAMLPDDATEVERLRVAFGVSQRALARAYEELESCRATGAFARHASSPAVPKDDARALLHLQRELDEARSVIERLRRRVGGYRSHNRRLTQENEALSQKLIQAQALASPSDSLPTPPPPHCQTCELMSRCRDVLGERVVHLEAHRDALQEIIASLNATNNRLASDLAVLQGNMGNTRLLHMLRAHQENSMFLEQRARLLEAENIRLRSQSEELPCPRDDPMDGQHHHPGPSQDRGPLLPPPPHQQQEPTPLQDRIIVSESQERPTLYVTRVSESFVLNGHQAPEIGHPAVVDGDASLRRPPAPENPRQAKKARSGSPLLRRAIANNMGMLII